MPEFDGTPQRGPQTRGAWRWLRASACIVGVAVAGPGQAQIEDVEGRLLIELNAAQSDARGCSLSFLVINGLSAPIQRLVLEAVLFDTGGQVNTLTLFDFGELPATRPRVRQFVLPETPCEGVGAVLINGSDTCEAQGDTALNCADALDLRSRTDIELLG